MKKACALCLCPAKIFCDADQASLCWDCDHKVHSANFLVARHSRCSLCHLCQAPTLWAADGPKLGQTVSLCNVCAASSSGTAEAEKAEESVGGGNEEDDEDFGTDVESEYEDGFSDSCESEDEDNQVVPLSSSTPCPPPTSSSSSIDDNLSIRFNSSKRISQVADLDSNGHIVNFCSSSALHHNNTLTCEEEKAIYLKSRTTFKRQRTSETISSESHSRSRSTATLAINPQENTIHAGNKSPSATSLFTR